MTTQTVNKTTVPAGYKQTEVGVIPVDWDCTTVGAEFDIQLGKMLDVEKNTGVPRPFIGNRAVQWGRIDVSDIGTILLTPSDLRRFWLRAGDLLVCEGGEVGRAAIWRGQIRECYYQKALHRLRPKRRYVERETHFVWGKRYLMRIAEDSCVGVELEHRTIVLHVRPGTAVQRKQRIVQEWYRGLLKDAIPPLLQRWEPVVGVSPESVAVRRMKTLWGSCSPRRLTIRINLELAKKPPGCLEYILLHELVHLLEPTHNAHFVAHMDRLMPEWRHRRDELNRLPVPHEDWGY